MTPRPYSIGDVHEVTMKEKLQAMLDSRTGLAMEVINVLLSVGLIVVAVIQSYDDLESAETDTAVRYIELFSALWFAGDFAIRIYAADRPWRVVMSPMGIIDCVTIIPMMIAFFLASVTADALPVLRIMRVFRALGILRLYRVIRVYHGYEYEVKTRPRFALSERTANEFLSCDRTHQLAVLIFTMFCLVFVAAGVFQILEEHREAGPLLFHQAAYFVFVTVSTVGYGDITPTTAACRSQSISCSSWIGIQMLTSVRSFPAQMLVMVMLIIVLIVVPPQIRKLAELSRLQKRYLHSYNGHRRPRHAINGHVIVTGTFGDDTVAEFLAEFYRDHVSIDVVIMVDQVPSTRMLNLVHSYRYRRHVQYLKGSLLNDKDSERAALGKSSAVFILGVDKPHVCADSTDSLSILHALAIDKASFVAGNDTRGLQRKELSPPRCFIQILSPQRMNGLRAITGADIVFNVPRLRTAIVTRSVVCPGATAVLLNLIHRVDVRILENQAAHDCGWVIEYAHGLKYQLFPVLLPPQFEGVPYTRAVYELYVEFNVLLLGVYNRSRALHGHNRIMLCPFSIQAWGKDSLFELGHRTLDPLNPEMHSMALRLLRHHVVIAGAFADCYATADYLDVVYRTSGMTCPTVILLVSSIPKVAELDVCCTGLRNVLVAHGSADDPDDLLRVRACDALATLVIPGLSSSQLLEQIHSTCKNARMNEYLVDYKAVMSTLCIHALQRERDAGMLSPSRPSHTVTVLKRLESISYFCYNDCMGERMMPAAVRPVSSCLTASFAPDTSLLPVQFTTAFVAGEVFVESVLDTLLCQSFFNPYVIDVIRLLAGDYDLSDLTPRDRCPVSSSIEPTPLCPTMATCRPARLSTMRMDSSGSRGEVDCNTRGTTAKESSEQTSDQSCGAADQRVPVLSTANIGAALEGHSFQHVFHRALAQQILVIGIYRSANVNARGNTQPYVFTCPPADDLSCRVYRGDVLHVVSSRPPPLSVERAGICIESLNVGLSVLLVIISVVQSYQHDISDAEKTAVRYFEFISNIFFTFDYLLHLYAAEERMRFIVSPMGIIDLLTIIPTYISFFITDVNAPIEFFRIARVFRALSVLRLYRVISSYRGYDYELAVLIFSTFTLIFVAASVFQTLETDWYAKQQNSDFQFHQAVYFVFVTISTVGYGDITPHTTASQMVVMFMLIVVVTIIPRQLNRIHELSKLQNGYMHSYNLRKRSVQNGGHVVVTGSVEYESAAEFLAEFYRSRLGRVHMDVVILADQIPSQRLQSLLRGAAYRRRTTYLKGTLLNEKDAERAHIKEAAAVFILADKKNPKHSDAHDALTVLQALAIDKYRFRLRNGATSSSPGGVRKREIRCFLQVISPLRSRGLRTITGVEVALNNPRLRTAILARNLLCPGAIALLLNLIYSAPEQDVARAKSHDVPWIGEYAHGLQHQIFPVYLPPYFVGMKYEQAALGLYKHFQIMFLAVYDRKAGERDRKRISLSPFGQVLQENDLGFFIAPSAAMAKHAVDSLFRADEMYPLRSHNLPTLVYSSESVLDRQSLVKERSHSILLLNDDDDVSSSDGGEEIVHACAFDDMSITDATEGSTTTAATMSPLFQSCQVRSPGQSLPVTSLHRAGSTLNAAMLKRLRNHIIICGPFAHGHQLACYLDELYAREQPSMSQDTSATSHPTILLLVKKLPRHVDIDDLPCPLPDNVFVEKGVSQNVEDLLRVRAFDAKAVLMIPGNWNVDEMREENTEDVNEHLMDYQVIMSTLSLRTVHDLHARHLSSNVSSTKSSLLVDSQMRPNGISVVKGHGSITYFAHKSERFATAGQHQMPAPIKYKPRSESFPSKDNDAVPASFSPSYAAGEIFVDGVLDTLLCQSFFNPYVIDIIRALAGDYYGNSSHASQSFACSMMRYFRDSRHRTASNDSTYGYSSTLHHEKSALPYPVLGIATLAPHLHGRSFSQVFAAALREQVLLIGIYRQPHEMTNGNALPYVYTCPEASSACRVLDGDLLHVVSQRRMPVVIGADTQSV
ncbi:TPA: hypothetical protein N0F65_003791 [Lagenidium giganteum]|uniref:Calcium-activated potassium channel n=1 Tax=Lagenidium giganteum TaxID=4803 RepID=A0AAV2YV14_9STRA|nr:TPA: hypothetical protein N0F65_003791 [Lagenidium giganteum]